MVPSEQESFVRSTRTGDSLETLNYIIRQWHRDVRLRLDSSPLSAGRHHEAAQLRLEIRYRQPRRLVEPRAPRGEDESKCPKILVHGGGGICYTANIGIR